MNDVLPRNVRQTFCAAHRLFVQDLVFVQSPGAPVFGPSGRVIGINFAALREGGYANFAVPVGGANMLIRRAGWRRE